MKIFMTGVSGYIGGAIAAKLIENGIEVRGLVREKEKAGMLAVRGITPVLGSLGDSDLLTQEARSSDGVINTADSDHRGAIEALIEGLAESDKPLLHTSGTGLYADDAKGGYPSPEVTALQSISLYVMRLTAEYAQLCYATPIYMVGVTE
jgi:uncharacterized protein YbjT (DUF2867 family)